MVFHYIVLEKNMEVTVMIPLSVVLHVCTAVALLGRAPDPSASELDLSGGSVVSVDHCNGWSTSVRLDCDSDKFRVTIISPQNRTAPTVHVLGGALPPENKPHPERNCDPVWNMMRLLTDDDRDETQIQSPPVLTAGRGISFESDTRIGFHLCDTKTAYDKDGLGLQYRNALQLREYFQVAGPRGGDPEVHLVSLTHIRLTCSWRNEAVAVCDVPAPSVKQTLQFCQRQDFKGVPSKSLQVEVWSRFRDNDTKMPWSGSTPFLTTAEWDSVYFGLSGPWFQFDREPQEDFRSFGVSVKCVVRPSNPEPEQTCAIALPANTIYKSEDKQVWTTGEMLLLQCVDGTTPISGLPTLTCTETGEWDSTPLVCAREETTAATKGPTTTGIKEPVTTTTFPTPVQTTTDTTSTPADDPVDPPGNPGPGGTNGASEVLADVRELGSDLPVGILALGGTGGVAVVVVVLIFAIDLRRQQVTVQVRKDLLIRALPKVVLEHYEIDRKRLKLGKVIGSGSNGVVLKGTLLATRKDADGTSDEVAIKTPRGYSAGPGSMDSLLREVSMMVKLNFRNRNVVNLLGVVVKRDLMLVMEYCEPGALDKMLRAHKASFHTCRRAHASSTNKARKEPLDIPTCRLCRQEVFHTVLEKGDLVKFAHGISCGMYFLSTHDIVHRDLAARNVLIDHNMTAKLSDFATARTAQHPDTHRGFNKILLPVRWMAPERFISDRAELPGDVWSFGVVLWEIYTLGDIPYLDVFPKATNTQFVHDLIAYLRSGSRLEVPPLCPPAMARIMRSCWLSPSRDRPDFASVKDQLERQLPWSSLEAYVEFRVIDDVPDDEFDKISRQIDWTTNLLEP